MTGCWKNLGLRVKDNHAAFDQILSTNCSERRAPLLHRFRLRTTGPPLAIPHVHRGPPPLRRPLLQQIRDRIAELPTSGPSMRGVEPQKTYTRIKQGRPRQLAIGHLLTGQTYCRSCEIRLRLGAVRPKTLLRSPTLIIATFTPLAANA